jgi:hypothetical protein
VTFQLRFGVRDIDGSQTPSYRATTGSPPELDQLGRKTRIEIGPFFRQHLAKRPIPDLCRLRAEARASKPAPAAPSTTAIRRSVN